jgi:DNA polymerase-3 subunit beta
MGGEGKEVLECEYSGEEIEMGYNAAYIADILNKIEGDDVVLELTTPVAAGVVYGTGVERDDFLCLIMPLRLAD